MKIIWTRESIENCISEYNPQNAIEFTDSLINKCEYLVDNPNMGRIVPELPESNIRELIHKNYRIVYRHSDQEIQILTVFEDHRLLPLDN